MKYEILLEKEDRIQRLGFNLSKEDAEKGLKNYIENNIDDDFDIWIEKQD